MPLGLRTFAAAVALILAGCATTAGPTSPAAVAAADRALARWTAPTLETFADEAEFRRYLRDARRAALARDLWWEGARHDDAGDTQSITVTGSRIPARNASITNVQEAGVDEGDIVKQIDRFLIVLQDGRLFSIDTGAGPGAPLRLADRVNVYRNAALNRNGGIWYDEMLVLGDRILVTGYSYRQSAAEMSVFRMAPDGRLAREGVFFISSNDYYDGRNYATRLVDGNLLIYTPIELNAVDPERPLTWPMIRRWRPGDDDPNVEEDEVRRWRGRRLFDTAVIHRPLFATVEPTVHTITLCPLGRDIAGHDLECRSTAFIGGPSRQLYVSPGDAFLILGPGWEDLKGAADAARCGTGRPAAADVYPTHIYRIPIRGGDPGVLGIRGGTFDQFSMQAHDGAFRALLHWGSIHCEAASDGDFRPETHFTWFSTPISAFSPVLREAPPAAYAPLPSIGARYGDTIVDRFTDHYLVYGRLGRARRYSDDDVPLTADLAAVPIAQPSAARMVPIPHNIVRAEQAGDNVVLTGYSAEPGLSVSLVSLAGAPRVASTHRFADRTESEGRSHAFNSLIAVDGSGLMGLPTVARAEGDDDRPVWRSRASDLSFLSVDAAGRLAPLGALVRRLDYDQDGQEGVAGYSCEVSCIDWYGNSRPIFTDGRIFALAGAELIEGRREGGRVVELQRLNIALAAAPR